jgi:hypothetical protein
VTGDLRAQYALAVATGYGSLLIHNGSQLLLVPLYLNALGKYEFGILMLVFAVVNAAGAGIAWLTGGMLRILGEYSALADHSRFGRAFALLRAGYLVYAVVLGVVFLIVLELNVDVWFQQSSPDSRAALVRGLRLCPLYLIAAYDLGVERLALVASGRQVTANNVFALSALAYISFVIPALLLGGRFDGVIACLTLGCAIASLAAKIYRRRAGLHGGVLRFDGDSRLILWRVVGPMGAGYFAYGLIVLALGADLLLVGWLGGAVVAAEFALIWKPAELVTQLLWKLPEHATPFLIRMDVLGDRARLLRLYTRSLRWIMAVALIAAIAYGAVGPWLVRMWVGSAAPDDRIAFVLAGAAVFWLAVARLPSVFAYATVRLRQLLTVSGIELTAKVVVTMSLFSELGYLAPLVAINAIHVLGLAVAYRRLMPTPPAQSIHPPTAAVS